MTLRYFVDSWSTWSYQLNSKWRLSSGCRQKYSSWFFRLFSPSLIKTYILVQLTNEEKLFLNRRWQQSNDRYGNISSWRMLKSSMIFPSFLLHSWSKYPFLFFSFDEMLAKNTRMHDLGRNYSKILHKLNIFERLVDGDSNGFLTNFASFFLQVSVTIWHLPIRERERKKRLDHFEKKQRYWSNKQTQWQSRKFFSTKTASDLSGSIVHFQRRLIYKYLTSMWGNGKWQGKSFWSCENLLVC